MINVREIKLEKRYPESRQEDITDAFTRGYTGAVEIGNKAIKKLEAENAKLRERVAELVELLPDSGRWYRAETVEAYVAEIAKLRELVAQMYRDMQGVLDMSTDTVFVDTIGTLRDKMDWYMQAMADLGMPPADYEQRMRELGLRGEDA